MVGLVRHHQTKGVATDRPDLQASASARRYGGTVCRGTTGGHRKGGEESEAPDSTDEAGEGDPRRPGGGKRVFGLLNCREET